MTPEVISQNCGQGQHTKEDICQDLVGGGGEGSLARALGSTEQFSGEPTQQWVMWLLNFLVLGTDNNALNCKSVKRC